MKKIDEKKFTSKYTIVLFYKYIELENPTQEMNYQREVCKELGLTGRILLAEEGINGTLEGESQKVWEYIKIMQKDERFKDIDFKLAEGTGSAFPRLMIKVRKEIVTTGLQGEDRKIGPLHKTTGKYLSADELYNWYKEGKEFYIIDMRNDFEYDVGRFQNSIWCPDMYHFRDLPKALPQIEHLKNKTVLTVCTGGVRCETASGLLMKYGFKDVYQLHNGIHTFIEKYPNTFFDGKMYVFDGRMVWGFGSDLPEHKSIGKCKICQCASEHFVNWNDEDGTRKHGIICEKCCEKGAVNLQEGYKKQFQNACKVELKKI